MITDQLYFFRSADCLWNLANGLESDDLSGDHRLTVG